MVGFDAMKTEVITRLGNRQDISARVERWINYAFFELLLNPRFSFFELDKSTTFVTVSGTSTYNLPADLWFILDLRDVTNNRKLVRSHWQVLDRLTTTTSQPVRYARFTLQVQFDPTPDGAYTIALRYRVRPSDMTSGSTFQGLGTEWEEVICTMSAIKGFESLDQREKAGEQRALLEQLLSTRHDVPELEDADAEITISPAMIYRTIS